MFVVAGAVHAVGEDLIEADHFLGAAAFQHLLMAGVDAGNHHVVGELQNGARVVGEDDFTLALADFLVVLNIVNAGELVYCVRENLLEFRIGEHIRVRIDI